MQTFLPFPSFRETAQVLDNRRLGKQRVETLQILRTLAGLSTGWSSHPAVRMWEGYEPALVRYQQEICDEWVFGRGFRDSCLQKTLEILHPPAGPFVFPHWLGRIDIHEAYQSNLVRKDPDYYRQYFQNVPDDLSYIWPV